MNISDLKTRIELAFENNDLYNKNDVDLVISLLNSGQIKISEKVNGEYKTNSWIKKAILLMFKNTKADIQDFDSYDKIGLLKYDENLQRYRKATGSFIRNGVYIGNNAVIMPSYINIGAYIGNNTMIDINSAIGSCAQIGENCHISALACIGGVLEPAVATPVIIEDNCFIGAHSSVLEGCIVEENSIISSGVHISSSVKIIDRETGEIYYGKIPSGSVVVPGSYQSKNGINISCAVIAKRTDEKSISKSSINDILRSV